MKTSKQDLWKDAKTVRIYNKTHKAMQQLCPKGDTYADIIDDLFQYRYAKEMHKLNDNSE
jgi:transcriptional regulator